MEEELPKQIPEVEDNIKFKYSDCQIRPRTEIRILNLLPSITSNPDALHCTLSVARLEDKPSYEALSYVWGPPVFPERLYLPSGYVCITTSLAAALRQFRYPDHQRQLWVDAVCINQQDDIEKGHQVRLMSQLYRNTQCALAWLGENHRNTRATFGILEGLAYGHQFFEINRNDAFFEVFRKLKVSDPENETKSGLRNFANLIIPPINTPFQLPWFERLWIIQEAVLPGKVQVCWGFNTLDLDNFTLSIKVVVAIQSSSSRLCKDWIPLIFFCDLRENFHEILAGHGGNKTRIIECNLFDLVANFSSSKACYNDMDRMFDLLGLRSDEDIGFEVNYEGSVESVYFDFALKALESVHPDIFLSEASRIYDKTDRICQSMFIRLPGWVPDWRCTRLTDSLSMEPFFSAASLPKSLSYNKETLPFIGIRGVRVDIIAEDLSTIFLIEMICTR